MPAKKKTASTRAPVTVSGVKLVSFEEVFADVIDDIDEALEKEDFVTKIRAIMKAQKVSEVVLAERMKTSRSTLRNVLDVKQGSNVASMAKAARALGARIRISVVVPKRSSRSA